MDYNKEGGYRYFQVERLKQKIQLSSKLLKKSRDLLEKGLVKLDRVETGYFPGTEELTARLRGRGISEKDRREFPVSMVFTREDLLEVRCMCPECMRNPYYYYIAEQKLCAYQGAILEEGQKFFEQNSIGDATDRRGSMFLNSFRAERKRALQNRKQSREGLVRQSQNIELVPRLYRNNGDLELSFRVGSSKKYIIRNFSQFCEHVKNREPGIYGQKTQISHDPEDFAPDSRPFLSFIQRMVQEDQRQYERMQDLMSRGTMKQPKQSVLLLYGWRLDQFWKLMEGREAEYEDKDSAIKNSTIVRFCENNPDITMTIEPHRKENGDVLPVFEGVQVHVDLPPHWEGVDVVYFLDGNCLCRAEQSFSEGIRQLTSEERWKVTDFRIGRNRLSEFYHDVLPSLEKYITVVEKEQAAIRSFVTPEASFVFYLDYEDGMISCQALAGYGEEEYSLGQLLNQKVVPSPRRQLEKEEEVLELLLDLYPEYDLAEDRFFCSDDQEDQCYLILTEGTERMEAYGEVMCTSRFKSLNSGKRMKVAVGVSVSGGLLNLQITSEDVSREELLDILAAYRPSRKYFRLKNGSFLDMQDDSVVMLNELMQNMNLPAKEILKENIEIPAYRSLYLDLLLEESQSVYPERDRKFRQLVRSFRSIGDADFEEPSSLSGVLRSYQREGYQWIRTLAEYGFGGILADDMGLGKTLQAIAVLLAGKETGEGTSLVVCPASLVYNWLEEIRRYAPQLRAEAVAGTQKERRQIISEWENLDILVTSYDLLKRDISLYEGIEFFYEIADEAQYIKNHSTAAAKAVKVVRSRHRLALTGTPVENRLSELWSIFDFLMPGFLYGYDTFKAKFETPVVRHQDPDALRRLQKMTAPFILRRLKGDVLKDLPEKLEENRVVQFGDRQQKLYDAQVVHMQNMIRAQSSDDFGKNKIQILAELTKLRQICCDPSLCFENYDGGSAKLESCMDLVESAMDAEHRMLIFSQFTSMLELIQKELKRRKIPFYVITGGTPKEERIRLVREFNQNDVPVFLISLKAGGTGLNLTGADIVIHYDPWWNVAAQNQATDRAHRIGQTKNVTVYKMIAKNSIEEKIQKLQETKQHLADSIVGAADGISLGTLSQSDLLDLLR
ncbi:MAG: DEAD/DEAH box helicase [Anaerovoracaceae bacterium]